MTKTTCIYHRADFDGLFCREIARKFLPDAQLIGWDYGDPLIEIPDAGLVYILDLSPECLAALSEDHADYNWLWPRVIWIDHHKTAIEKFNASIPGYRIDGVAACRLAWFYFTALERYKAQTTTADFTWFQGHYPWAAKQDFVDRKLEEPYAVRLAGEYDIWDKRDPKAEIFQLGLRSRELLSWHWRDLLDNTVSDSLKGTGMEQTSSELLSTALLQSGHTLKFVRDQEYSEVILEQGFDVQFEGYKYLACNSHELDIRSQLFDAGLKPEHDGCLGFTFNGKDWRVSLYGVPSKPDIDHSVVAKKYGGGGHRAACGFRVDKLPFLP